MLTAPEKVNTERGRLEAVTVDEARRLALVEQLFLGARLVARHRRDVHRPTQERGRCDAEEHAREAPTVHGHKPP